MIYPGQPGVVSGELVDGDLLLRRPHPADAADRLAAGRDADYVRMCGGDDRDLAPLTEKDAARWLASVSAEPLGWAIEHDGRCVGHARLHHHEPADRRARFTIGIFDRAARGRGIGTRATWLVLSFAFGQLGLHRVDLRVLEYNHRAIACYSKCGFTREGIERESAMIGDRWYSDVMMSILESEFRALAARRDVA